MTHIASFERVAQEKGKLEQSQKSITDTLNFRFEVVSEQLSYSRENLHDLASLRDG